MRSKYFLTTSWQVINEASCAFRPGSDLISKEGAPWTTQALLSRFIFICVLNYMMRKHNQMKALRLKYQWKKKPKLQHSRRNARRRYWLREKTNPAVMAHQS
jgi:hypothetical protein